MIGTELVNFRDLGGIQTQDGRKIAAKRLLRCGDISVLTEETICVLEKEYNVVHTIDFRTEKERGKAPDCEIPGAKRHVIDFFPGEDLMGHGNQATGSKEQLMKMQDVALLHHYMKKLYAEFITTDTARKALHEFLQILLHTEKGAVLFHCFAGKDRTGIAAAVILTILGVSKESILKDYLETNHMRERANQSILEDLRQKGAPERMIETVKAALSVEKDYLNESFRIAEQDYGSFENYIEKGIGTDKKEWKRLRSLYLV